MSDRQKLEAILNLLTDKTVGQLVAKGTLTKDEEHAGLVTIGHVFNRAFAIANQD